MWTCSVCKTTKDNCHVFHRTVVHMEGGWRLNHFGSEHRNIFGRLVLAPKKDYSIISKLGDTEACKLGINIKRIESALRHCPIEPYKSEPIKGIYTTYFNETEKKIECKRVHIHIFPINELLYNEIKQLADEKDINDKCKYDVWKLGELLEYQHFPDVYKVIKNGQIIKSRKERINDLMKFLQRELSD